MTIRKSLRFSFIPSLLGLMLLSCSQTNSKDISNIETIDPQSISLGPIVHDTLSPHQITQIERIQKVFAEVYPISLEETITNFKRDRHPDSEIVIWLAMATAYEKFTSKRPDIGLAEKKEVFKLILNRSMVNEEDAKAQSDLRLLTDQEAKEILSYYNLDAKPLTVESK